MPKHRAGFLSLAVVVALLAIGFWTFVVGARPATDLQQWQPDWKLPYPLASHGAVVHDGYLYLVGGRMESGFSTAAVCSAKILSKGKLDVCNGQPGLPAELAFHAVVTSTSHLYVLGGWDERKQIFHNKVWRADFRSDGNLGPWMTYGYFYEKRPLVFHDALLIHNKYLYVIGGQDDRERIQKKVFYVDITSAYVNTTTEQLDWRPAPDLPVPLDKLSAVVKGDFIYVTGGRDDHKKTRKEVYYIKIDKTGLIADTEWHTASEKLPEPREYHKAIVFDDRLVILGGKEYKGGGVNDNEWNSIIYASSIEANGNPHAWSLLPGMIESLQRFAVVTFEKDSAQRLYLLGGLHGAEYRETAYQLVAPIPGFTLAVAPAYIENADRLIYTITLRSPYTLSNVTMSNRLPDNAKIVANTLRASPSISGTPVITEGTQLLRWQLKPNLALPSVVTVAYQVALAAPLANNVIATVTNPGAVATWSYLGYPGSIKSAPGTALLPYAPQLTLTGQTGRSVDGETEVFNYRVYYKNGAYTLTNLSIVNTIPASVTVIPSSAGCTPLCLSAVEPENNPEQQMRWNPPTLSPGASGQVFYSVRRLPLSIADGVIKNQGATIHWHYQEATGSHTSKAFSTILPYEKFMLRNAPHGQVSVGDTITYTIVFINGGDVLQNIYITNTIPLSVVRKSESIHSAGLDWVGQGKDAGTNMVWYADSIASNAQITMSYSVTKTNDGPIFNEGAIIGWFYNGKASITYSSGRSNPSFYQFLPLVSYSVAQ
ncbi:MAG: hypothetical protein DYG89_22570 [Caldilinea sp. CFX5]|nr:hypothetical protein [Caldilinea sp. CFX5]